jgi:hypothetical protein
MSLRCKPILRSSAFAVALLAVAGVAWASGSLTVPSSVGAGEGNLDNLYPFNGDPIRYQQVIGASEFSGAGAGWITQIRLRPDGVSGNAFSETLTNVKISLSTSQRPTNNLSTTFSQNVGSDNTVVYTGALALSSAFSGPDGGPKAFDIVITLQSPFYYDPSAGNLLLDVTNFTGGKTTQMDAQNSPDTTSRVWSLNVNAATATSTDPYPSAGLVMQFVFQ